jgi:hypothetical protein
VSTEAGHLVDNLLLFSQTLRRAGLPIAPQQSIDFASALTLVDIGSREQVYHAARSLMVTRREHLHLFDVLFDRFWRYHSNGIPWRGQAAPLAARHKPRTEKRFDVVTYMAQKARAGDPEIEVKNRSGTYSDAELLQRKEFSQMSPEELEAIKRLIQEMRWQVSLRRTRRRVPDRGGDTLHLRQAMRSAAKYGGIPLHLHWLRRKVKQRPFILIADISGSMEMYARLMLQFFYSISHSLKDVECFVFGTRLSRITPQMKLKNIDRAVEQAAREIVDWSGGTRIGDSLKTFNRRWGRRVLRRGAIVMIVSDGWERGDVTTLKQEVGHLQRRCHRLIWLNPLLGKPTYQPLVEGMAAALVYVDDFLPVHNWHSLTALSRHLASLGQYRTGKARLGLRAMN